MKSKTWMHLIAVLIWITSCSVPIGSSITPQAVPNDTIQPDLPIPLKTMNSTPHIASSNIPGGELPLITPKTTPYPTLTLDEGKTLIFELFQKHEACRLPCLWGFKPGENDVESARAFVSHFGSQEKSGKIEISARNYDNAGGLGITYTANKTTIVVDWEYRKSNDNTSLKLLRMYAYSLESLETDPISGLPLLAPVYGDAAFNQELKDYFLSPILKAYGPPSQVLVSVGLDDLERPHIQWHPFSIALFYLEEGIYIEYVSPRETQDRFYVGCPNKSHITVATWDYHENLTLEEIIKEAGSELVWWNAKTITEAASLTVNEFYQVFKESENTNCLQTPQSLWQPAP